MAHHIEITNGEARFAFNQSNGDPWHMLGTAMEGYETVDSMLIAAQANWDVTLQPIFIEGSNGNIEVPDKRATVRQEFVLDADGVSTVSTPLGVVGKNYTVDQNFETANWGLDLVGASRGDAVIDTMGVLHNGREFFVGIDLGTIVLDPEGIGDVIKKYLVVRNSHDGTMSLSAYPTNTRVVCWNTATMSMRNADRTKQVYKVRHTSGKEHRKAEAVEAMGLAKQVSELWIKQASAMIDIDGGHDVVDKAIEAVWPRPNHEEVTERVMNTWHDRRNSIHDLYVGDTCSAQFGSSGWTAWNAITEYLDHNGKTVNTVKRAVASMDINGTVAKAKDIAAQRILQLA
jgi:phage/plasmid-like protein (TIGR03299 family)